MGLEKGIINRTNGEKNIENVIRGIDLLGNSRFVSDLS